MKKHFSNFKTFIIFLTMGLLHYVIYLEKYSLNNVNKLLDFNTNQMVLFLESYQKITEPNDKIELIDVLLVLATILLLGEEYFRRKNFVENWGADPKLLKEFFFSLGIILDDYE
jgi:hypothetical protein